MSDNNKNQKGFVLWFTGFSQSGKSTTADAVFNELKNIGYKVERLDGDVVREHLWKDLGFSKEDKDENIRRAGYLAKILSRNGVGVVASFISPYKEERDGVRKEVDNFIEIFCNCPLEVCEKRDTKGWYQKARKGEIQFFTGISDPYEKPENPEIELFTDKETTEECVEKVINYLKEKNFIGNNQKEIKILSTLGPSSMSESIVKNMDMSGVDIFRINMSHTKIEDLEGIIKNVTSWTKKPVCIDTEGAQIRTGKIKGGSVLVNNNDIVFLTENNIEGDGSHIPLHLINPSKDLKLGDILYIDFNHLIIQVIKIEGDEVACRVLSGGELGSNKGIHLDREIALPAFTEKDIKAFEIAKKYNLNHIAFSFAGRKRDVEKIRSIFPYDVFIVSKIECRPGMSNLEEICEASDAVLIDRGDLSREVPVHKIGIAQKHILNIAKSKNTPLYVATNLLESMIHRGDPTRAEVNDITSALYAGADGLVLAAETAIGKYPVESVRIVSSIIKSVREDKKNDDEDFDFLKTIYDYNLIEPHGGMLVQNYLDSKEKENLENLKKIKIDEKTLLDTFQIAEGVYSPIKGFMNSTELNSVLDNYKLPNGVVWPLPILFQMKKEEITFGENESIILMSEDEKSTILMKVSGIEEINSKDIAKRWFGTEDENHPGVSSFLKKGNCIISGEVFLITKSPYYSQFYTLTPKQTREVFKDRGWQKIVGFHTRNVIHLGHEFVQQAALRLVGADALFISPVVGPKKSNDFSAEAILTSYNVMIKNDFYAPYPALVGAFNTYSRYSGPREAVFTALCRKNFGCSHFVVGRDHTGVGNYYAPDASQKLFDKLGDIGIIPLMFDAVLYCDICNKPTINCEHGKENKKEISGTNVRKCIIDNVDIPEYLMRKEISSALREIANDKTKKLFVE